MAIRSYLQTAVICLLGFLLGSAAAEAHPHVWVTAKSELIYAADGTLKAVRHHWTFDEMFSAFAVQGLDKDNDGKLSREELSELATVNVTSLKEFEYFSVAKIGGNRIVFEAPADYWLEADTSKILTLHFTLPVKAGTPKGLFTVDIYDPTYFVAFSFADDKPATLSGAAANCSVEVRRPETATSTKPLSESFFSSLSAGSDFGAQFANRITVHCP